ncbi:hypothetical protein GQS52_14800 [Streptomyces sp. SCUT-3]|uniref:hypothetical protein n=1 Tax=Streptomyces sp. SCUT-3 TaxID=2684469 RepID=UPI0015F7A8B5|nr:hypothetical protein [Streptomyces sp. SCUT-3]QMV22832.1 hypothetical protein GQS52_14800 [Streptomyces sp. SCUT-3]
MAWLHGRAVELAEQLHPACRRAVRAWRGDAGAGAEAVQRLLGGERYRFSVGDDGVRYAVTARPLYVPRATPTPTPTPRPLPRTPHPPPALLRSRRTAAANRKEK